MTMVALTALALLPDFDFLGPLLFDVDNDSAFGHRGATHSLAFAAFIGVVVGASSPLLGLPRVRAGVIAACVVASHALLDAFTDTGAAGGGVALLWPFVDGRVTSPWRPLPIAPIGPELLTAHGIALLLAETAVFLPLWLFALWPRRLTRPTAPRRAQD